MKDRSMLIVEHNGNHVFTVLANPKTNHIPTEALRLMHQAFTKDAGYTIKHATGDVTAKVEV